MGNSAVKRAFKFRFYPDDAQATELSKTFGCVRKVYNLALAARAEARARREPVGYARTSAMLTAWKQTPELAFLNEVSCVPLQQALRHLQRAFDAFRDGRSRHPRFKSKRSSRASAEYTRSAFRFRDGLLTFAKMAGPLSVVWSRRLPAGAKPTTVTVSRDRLARAQRALSRKEKGSANRTKARVRVAKVHARIADRRRDHLHKLTTRLVRENQTLVIEDLSVRTMQKNPRLARAISDAAWRELRSMLEYKTAWYGRELIAIDRWHPSSKLCSVCGALVRDMPLSIRAWRCAGCGTEHDRDENAAINLLAAGLAVSACGAGVGPRRASAAPGQRAMKQEGPPVRAGRPPFREGDEAKQPNVGVSNAALPSAMPADTLRTSSQQ
ncbi:RNA-guided endonuclease InsQ/TnpB family protein [Streptomyces erythrochromogenes]|uniref:RNA-guided endonuclease InsQ/TnpB family protein n=1 Tax=Streptomyces erythrochromogenes TaxID=285574 RepID=UPI003699FD06